MTYPFSKSINYDKLSTYPELSASIKHNFSPNKHANLIHLKSKQNSTVDFTFKYTSEQHLASVVKHVRRRRQHEQDEEEWKLFYKKKQMEEEIEEQKQLFKNNTDIDEDGSLVPELVIDTSEIVNEEDRSGNMCKCIQSEVVNDIKCLHINDDIVSEGSDQCTTKQRILGLSHQPPTNGHCCMYPVKTHEAKLVDHHLLNYITESNRRISEVSEPLSMGVLKKMEDLVTYINKIGMILTTSQNESVDSDVAERNLKRNTEFTTLFARNYLYRVQRQKKEAKKIFVGGFPLPQQKLATMYQTALQALQVYERHLLKSCIHKKCMQQLEQIFDFIIYLITLTEKVTGGENFLHKHELIDGSKQLKCILFERAKVETNIMSSTVVKKQVSKPLKTKRKTQDKLSMYVSNQTKPFWKKSSAKLAKLKFGPPSAHKSHEHKKGREISVPNLSGKKSKEIEPNETKVTFEKLDNIQERELQNKNVENEITLKKSFRKATRAVPEEEVVTMMEILKHQFNDETDEDENIQPLPTTLKEDSVKVFPNGAEVLLQNVSREQLRDEVENSGDQKSMVSGKINSNTLWPKNIQMVCIKAEELKNKDINISVPSNPGVKDNSNEPKNQTIHRLLVSNSDRDIALGYKKNCSAFAESFQAYEDDNKPWDIVSRISDEVTLDVLESVCQTLEIDIVIQKLYDLEFR